MPRAVRLQRSVRRGLAALIATTARRVAARAQARQRRERMARAPGTAAEAAETSDGEGGDGPSGAGTSGTGNNGEAGASNGQGGTGDDEAAPVIVSVSPEGDGVEKGAPLEIVFSEPMNTTSGLAVILESGGRASGAVRGGVVRRRHDAHTARRPARSPTRPGSTPTCRRASTR